MKNTSVFSLTYLPRSPKSPGQPVDVGFASELEASSIKPVRFTADHAVIAGDPEQKAPDHKVISPDHKAIDCVYEAIGCERKAIGFHHKAIASDRKQNECDPNEIASD